MSTRRAPAFSVVLACTLGVGGGRDDRADFELLTEGADPPLHEWVTRTGADVVLLPSRRRPLRSAKHPAAAELRRSTAAEIRIVDAR